MSYHLSVLYKVFPVSLGIPGREFRRSGVCEHQRNNRRVRPVRLSNEILQDSDTT